MKRAALFAGLCCSCVALRERPAREQPACVYVGDTQFNPRAPFLEVDTAGPVTIIGVHQQDSYLVVRDRRLFRCTAR
ncbi:MAG: hypothetical protein LC689_20770 [Myxococcales bacterium]|nr:hypothetical protein [Myxococcales bacterium]